MRGAAATLLLIASAGGACSAGPKSAAVPAPAARAPSRSLADAGSVDASTAVATAPTAPILPPLPPGAPIMLTGAHSPIGSVWLPNGHLLVPTSTETLEIDPEQLDAPWRVRPPLQKEPLLAIVGTGGGDRFLALDAKGITVWDATTLTPVKTLVTAERLVEDRTLAERFSGVPMAISADGATIATVDTREGETGGTVTVFDAHTLAPTATLEPPDDMDLLAYQLALDESGTRLIEISGDAIWLRDVASGKTLVHRDLPRTSSRGLGSSTDVAEFHGGRVLVSSREGLEVFDAKTGKRVARTLDSRAMDPLTMAVSADGTKFLFGRYSWNAVHGGPVVREKSALEPRLEDRWPFVPRSSLRTDGHFSTMCRPEGLEVDDAHGQVLVRFGESRAATFASFRPLELFDGAVRARAEHPDDDVVFASTKKPRPKVPLHDDGSLAQAQSTTHLFAMDRKKKGSALVAWDAQGREVFRHAVDDSGGVAMTIQQVDGAVALVGSSNKLLRCDAAACVPLKTQLLSVDSFRDPWVVGIPTSHGAPVPLVNLQTGEAHAIPEKCTQHSVVLVGADGSFVCRLETGAWTLGRWTGLSATPLPLPVDDRLSFAFADPRSGHLDFNLDRDDFGVERAVDYDPATGRATRLSMVDRGGIVQHDDGTIERFGDVDAAAAALRCPTDAGWASYATCATRWETAKP